MSTQTTNTSIDRTQMHSEWQAMRTDFHRLVASIPPAAFRRRSVDTRWSIAEILAHLVHSLSIMPDAIESLRRGKDYLNLPRAVVPTANLIITKMQARNVTPQKLLADYDRAFDAAMVAFDGVDDAEWGRGGRMFGEGYRTVADYYRQAVSHFQEHAEQIRRSLAGTERSAPVPRSPGQPRENTSFTRAAIAAIPWKPALALTLVLAVLSLLFGPGGPLGGFWRPSDHVPVPTGVRLVLFVLLNIAEGLAFGLGTSFLIFGFPIVQAAAPAGARLTRAAHLSIAWLLINWWIHDSLHIHNGMALDGLLGIEYGFHVTLMAAGVVLATFFLTVLRPARALSV